MNTQNIIKKYSDKELINGLSAVGEKETESTAELLLHLAEIDSRKLYLQKGYSSLFDFCRRGPLRYSEGAAQRRIKAARAISRFPELLELFIAKDVNLCTLCLVAGVLTEENYSEVVSAISGKSKREVEVYVARFCPKQQLRESIKPVCVVPKKKAKTQESPLFSETQHAEISQEITATGGGNLAPSAEVDGGSNDSPVEQKYELRCQVKGGVMKKYREVQVLLSGKYPKGVGMEDLLEEVLDLYLDKHSPRRRQERRKARAKKAGSRVRSLKSVKSAGSQVSKGTTRYISQETRDRVFNRDGGRCSFVSAEGVRYGCRHDLEVDHVVPYSCGGDGSVDNLRLLCRRHVFQAQGYFGKGFMAQFLGGEGEAGTGR